MVLNTGKWSEAELEDLIHQASLLRRTGEKIEFISRHFLGTPYRESTLKGSIDTKEVLVINLEGVDCFTFLDYVEAMRLSASFGDFRDHIAKVRYRKGRVSFQERNHFFTDWREYSADRIEDVTGTISDGKAKRAVKTLNLKKDGSCFVPGIGVNKREIRFIPADKIDYPIIEGLESGDYIGIYSPLEGLDVSHAGILIKTEGGVFLRHASSRKDVRKVLDEDFTTYISGKPGLVALRPKSPLP